MEAYILELWNNYAANWGYVILFFWSILEGEIGLILAGMACYAGHMNVFLAISVAALGGFSGDQMYFYIGRTSKTYLNKKLEKQRRKLALAHLLLQKYGWFVIFIQRYMYGMRTIIPISIGLTRYNAFKFAAINLLSAFVWASITILLAWCFGEQLFNLLRLIKHYPYLLILILLVTVGFVVWYFQSHTKKMDKKIQEIQ
ncbi:DedA family protein [Helicobacter ailurogastricus]|uniref:DedA family protein n=1 Tax=Helicobacter ailurogastricus TaxID=1578720 RepID=A0A0K2Y4V9_9HELI|nr:DedA family protein [Helicobacter ailurogastricus]CRF40731.1 DedA family protein [Helicobacter ailurogastricus]CRF43123.1 DedA family protein [Helicobacter ailurogastricus]CRF44352.1 DedA family protein [Helicobacter ailurogastricus]CRF52175.1 DedA family protein [Helicobacter ailurogastricus]BDQ29294.1 membrane protein [Helicobacter ailurogastricus]